MYKCFDFSPNEDYSEYYEHGKNMYTSKESIIYSTLENYIGEKNKGLVLSEIKRELEEKAEDNRAIEEIADIEGKTKGDKMTISLTIVMTDKTEVEVEVDV